MTTPNNARLQGMNNIRLLILDPGLPSDDHISCNLSVVSLNDEPEYEALSYAWGDPNDTRLVMCSNKHLDVTINLHAALQHIRYLDKPRALWVDALCINQKDTEERNQQVSMMAEIYSVAQRVLIWLGDMTPEVRQSFRSIENALELFPKDNSEEAVLSNNTQNRVAGTDWKPLVSLLCRPYFRRKWILQEVVKARRALAILGSETISWDHIQNLVASLKYRGFIPYLAPELVNDLKRTGFDSIQNIALIADVRQQLRAGSKNDLLSLLAYTVGFCCTDPRDHVMSLLRLASDVDPEDSELTPDYGVTYEEMSKNLAVWYFREKKDLQLLSCVPYRPMSSVSILPLWIPDYRDYDIQGEGHYNNGTPLGRHETPFCASGDSVAQIHVSNNTTTLHVFGKAVDKSEALGRLPQDITPRPWTSDTHIRMWLSECTEIAFDGQGPPSPETYEAFCRTMLADMTIDLERATAEQLEMLTHWLRYMDGSLPNNTGTSTFLTAGRHIATSLEAIAACRRFSRTSNGRLGLMPKNAEQGDVICLLYGGTVPYVVRPRSDGQFDFVGDCYVHGLMYGEGMDVDGLETREFALR